MRRLLVLYILCACDLADDLKGEPCDVDDDCWHTQHCARTDVEEQAALPGVCMSKDIPCVVGQQLGCACNPTDSAADCSTATVPSPIEYPTMTCDATMLVCVVETPDASSEG